MFFNRFLSGPLAAPPSRNKVRLLFGARQTGKTSLLRHAVSEESSIRFDLAAGDIRRRFEIDPGSLGRELRALPRRIRHVVIDEIQKVPALLDEIQGIYDENRLRFQFFLTGSSARKLRSHSANLLPGRSHSFRLSPVCRWESLGPQRVSWPGAEAPAAGGPGHQALRPFREQGLDRTLLLGNLPGIRLEAVTTAVASLSAYVENYLEEEVRREALARDLGSFAAFLRLAARESGQQVNLASLSRESGVAASTLKNYYQLLVDTFVGYWVEPYSHRTRSRLLSLTPRFMLFDTGVRNAAASLSHGRDLLVSEGPRLFEQWVGLELRYRADLLGRGHCVSFWRTHSGAEIDFVWESPRADVPVEVKWTERPQPADARHVETFLDLHPGRAKRGLVVCRTPVVQQLSERVLAVPWDRF